MPGRAAPRSQPLLDHNAWSTPSPGGDVDGSSTSLLHPANPRFKYVVLFVNCMLTFGSYFCFDMPSTMKEELQQRYIDPWAPTTGSFQV